MSKEPGPGHVTLTKDTRVNLAVLILVLSGSWWLQGEIAEGRAAIASLIKLSESLESRVIANQAELTLREFRIRELERAGENVVGKTNEGWHKADTYNLCAELEKRNDGFDCPDPYKDIPQRFPR